MSKGDKDRTADRKAARENPMWENTSFHKKQKRKEDERRGKIDWTLERQSVDQTRTKGV